MCINTSQRICGKWERIFSTECLKHKAFQQQNNAPHKISAKIKRMQENAPRTWRCITSRTRRERDIFSLSARKRKGAGDLCAPALYVKNRTLLRQQRAVRVCIQCQGHGADNAPCYPRAKGFRCTRRGSYLLSYSPKPLEESLSFRFLSCCCISLLYPVD